MICEWQSYLCCFVSRLGCGWDNSLSGYRIMEDVIVKTSEKWSTDQIQDLVNEKVEDLELSIPVMGYIGELPESWQFLWSSRVAGLTRSLECASNVEPSCQVGPNSIILYSHIQLSVTLPYQTKPNCQALSMAEILS